jgi:hypothetical protein
LGHRTFVPEQYIVPPAARSRISQTIDGLEAAIPSRRNVFQWLFLTAWLLGWGVGEVLAAREVFSGRRGLADDLFTAAWLAAWTLGGVFAIYAWLWMVGGREVIRLRPTSLSVKREVFGMGRSREYDLNYVKNLRVAAEPTYTWDWIGAMRFWGLAGGPVAFDYGARTYRFGNGVDEAEGHQIVEALRAVHRFREWL